MDQATLQQLQRLRLSNLALSGAVRDRLEAALRRRWRVMDSWRDADMARLLKDVLPLVTAAERRTVDLTVASLAATTAAASGRPFRPATPDYKKVTGAALRGVDPADLFMRPQMVMNYTLAEGGSLTSAVAAGEQRLLSLATTNVQLAKTHTVRSVGRGTFYRRVLTGKENCALCVIASTQRYRVGSLAPIHPGCDCAVEEILGDVPPQIIDRDLLESTHTAIDQKLGATDRNLMDLDIGVHKTTAAGRPLSDFTELIITREHGELGPVLTWRSDHFRDAAEAAALT